MRPEHQAGCLHSHLWHSSESRIDYKATFFNILKIGHPNHYIAYVNSTPLQFEAGNQGLSFTCSKTKVIPHVIVLNNSLSPPWVWGWRCHRTPTHAPILVVVSVVRHISHYHRYAFRCVRQMSVIMFTNSPHLMTLMQIHECDMD